MSVITGRGKSLFKSRHEGKPALQLAPCRMRGYGGAVQRGKLRASVLFYPKFVFVLHKVAKLRNFLRFVKDINASYIRERRATLTNVLCVSSRAYLCSDINNV